MKFISAETSATGVATELSEKEPGRVYQLVVTFGPPAGAGETRNENRPASAPEAPAAGPTHEPPGPGQTRRPAPVEIMLKTDSTERPEIKVPIRPRPVPAATSNRTE
jgi:hypothetical protein